MSAGGDVVSLVEFRGPYEQQPRLRYYHPVSIPHATLERAVDYQQLRAYISSGRILNQTTPRAIISRSPRVQRVPVPQTSRFYNELINIPSLELTKLYRRRCAGTQTLHTDTV